MPSFKKLIEDLQKDFGFEDPTSGEMVRTFRKRIGLTLKDMQEITGIKESNLSKLENGKIDMTQHYAELCGIALDVPPEVLLYPGGKFDPGPRLKEVAKRAARVRARVKKQKVG